MDDDDTFRDLPELQAYKFDRILGRGTYGVVWAATHISTGDEVAVKVIPAAKVDEKIGQEVTNQQRLRHKHVIYVREVLVVNGDTYIFMELASGGGLFDYIVTRVRVPEDTARQIFQQIIAAVDHCHANHVAHRDLKPENIFLDNHDNVKLGDFGFSCELKDGELLKESCGSPNYAAPELLKRRCEYDGTAVDVWSCGVILYALLCSQLPFDEETISELFRKIKNGLYSMPHFVSEEAQDLIQKILVVDPAERITMQGIKDHPWFRKDIPLDLFESIGEEQSAEKLDIEDNDKNGYEVNAPSTENSIWHQTFSTLLDFSLSVASVFLPTSTKSPSTISLVTSEQILHKLTARCNSW